MTPKTATPATAPPVILRREEYLSAKDAAAYSEYRAGVAADTAAAEAETALQERRATFAGRTRQDPNLSGDAGLSAALEGLRSDVAGALARFVDRLESRDAALAGAIAGAVELGLTTPGEVYYRAAEPGRALFVDGRQLQPTAGGHWHKHATRIVAEELAGLRRARQART